MLNFSHENRVTRWKFPLKRARGSIKKTVHCSEIYKICMLQRQRKI